MKKGASIEYVSENRIFTDADDYSMEIELPLAGCQQNIDIFGMLIRKDIDADTIFFDAVLQDTNFYKRGAVVITEITHEYVKVQFLEKRSFQNFFPALTRCISMSLISVSGRVWHRRVLHLSRCGPDGRTTRRCPG